MFKIVTILVIPFLILLNAKRVESEIGINIGMNSTQNEGGFKFNNPAIGVTYQDDRYVVMPRVDLSYTKVNNDYASSLLKGSVNAIYEYENRTYTIPYLLAGVGYEYVGGATKDVFESHPFVQGGVGVRVDLEDGFKARVEGKMLQIVGGRNEGNEAIVTTGISMPLSYGVQNSRKPKLVKPRKVVRPKVITSRKRVKPKIVYVTNNECSIKINAPDLDRDGVEDRFDQCPATPCNFSVDSYGCPIKTTLRVNFANNSALLEGFSLQKVEIFANFLLKNRGSFVRIVGYTDSVGSAISNMRLSRARANAVVEALIRRGVSPVRLCAEGRGESMPIASNKTSYGRAMNRRIEAVLSYPKR